MTTRTVLLATFGLSATASLEDARAAYKTMVRALHPDVIGGDGALLKTVNDNWSALQRAFGSAVPKSGDAKPSPSKTHEYFEFDFRFLEDTLYRCLGIFMADMMEEYADALEKSARDRGHQNPLDHTPTKPISIHLPYKASYEGTTLVLALASGAAPSHNVAFVPTIVRTNATTIRVKNPLTLLADATPYNNRNYAEYALDTGKARLVYEGIRQPAYVFDVKNPDHLKMAALVSDRAATAYARVRKYQPKNTISWW